jgi:ABC-type bacteriocin/lantibiotic exporter with double-glycine peptidase domain
MPWTTQVASDGHTYSIYRQDQRNSCACASLAMFAKLALNKTLDESTVRTWVKEAEGGKNTDKEGVRGFQNVPTSRDLYGELFKKLKIISFPVKGPMNVAKWISNVSHAHPAICSVSWDGGGGHAVLAAKVHNGNIIFLDPGKGVVEIAIFDLPKYAVTYPNSARESKGKLKEMRTT